MLSIASGLLKGLLANRADDDARQQRDAAQDQSVLQIAAHYAGTPGYAVEDAAEPRRADAEGQDIGTLRGASGRAYRIVFDPSKTPDAIKLKQRQQRVDEIQQAYGVDPATADIAADAPGVLSQLAKPDKPAMQLPWQRAGFPDEPSYLDFLQRQSGARAAGRPSRATSGSSGSSGLSHLNPVVSDYRGQVATLEKRTKRPGNYDDLSDEAKQAFSADSAAAASQLPLLQRALQAIRAKRDSLAGVPASAGAAAAAPDSATLARNAKERDFAQQAQSAVAKIMASALPEAEKQRRVQSVNARLANAIAQLRSGTE
jgi:hypothetical protein